MNYAETLAYLYNHLPMFQRIGAAAYKKNLKNTLRLCAAIGNPELEFPTVHIAGTNGKGSVSAMIASVLTESGYRTGLYTSPHLRSFTERIRVNGQEIPEADVVAFVEKWRLLLEDVQPSFFEATVAMAFDHFARTAVDVGVIEVGMGGRLDSTNVIRPLLSVITNISFDHTDHLGDTLEKIAGEKAGIIKRRTPVVIGEEHPETFPVFTRVSRACGAPLSLAQERISVRRLAQDLRSQTFEVRHNEQLLFDALETDLPGDYQEKNAATAIEALLQLQQHFPAVTYETILSGFRRIRHHTGLTGRMTLLSENPSVVCDTAHNEAGVQVMLDQILRQPARQFHFVWGMVGDKDVTRVLRLLPAHATYYFVKPDIPRGLDAHQLAEKAAGFGLKGVVYDSVVEGLAAAKAAAGEDDLVFVGGSTFVVAEVV